MIYTKQDSGIVCPSRRRFIKTAGLAGMGMMAPGVFACASSPPERKIPDLPPLSGKTAAVSVQAVTKSASPEDIMKAVRRTAEAATDFSWLSRGDTVFIKPAANSPNVYPSTTSPTAVRAMARMLLEKGAGQVIVGDKPGVMTVHQEADDIRGSSREVLEKIGLQKAAAESGAVMHYFDEAGYDAYSGYRPSGGVHWQGELMMPDILKRVDHIVLLPRVSRHVLSGTTLGLKAAVGWLRDDSRLEFHRDADSFYEKIAEMNDVPVLRDKLRLVLTDGTRVLSTYGPDKGYATHPDPGLVFASESLLAHDMIALSWLLWNREFETPPDEISWFGDPYTGMPSTLNRGFVWYIWGTRNWYNYRHYQPVEMTSAATDPALVHAARLWGGFPEVTLEDVGQNMPSKIRTYLLARANVTARIQVASL